MCFCWGLQDSSVSIHLDAILGFEFESNYTPFSVDVLCESFLVFGFQIINSFMNTRTKRIIYFAILGILGVVMNFTTYLFEFSDNE